MLHTVGASIQFSFIILYLKNIQLQIIELNPESKLRNSSPAAVILCSVKLVHVWNTLPVNEI